jgi:uncharacterized protein (DUF4415 family)
MSENSTKRLSLADIKRLRDEGGLYHNPNAPEGENLGADFWENALINEPRRPRSVHLKRDPAVFDFFYNEANGKGHLTRMQQVLKAYVRAHKTAS